MMAEQRTAYVGHPDCSRHDTGWKHPEHQGRLPALARAVYRDMLALHGHLVEVEAQPASEADLLLVHIPPHVRVVREASVRASAAGTPLRLAGEVFVSAASWDAARAAVGTALTGADTVWDGAAANAFCAARPPGYAASADRVGGFSLFNNVAIAARHLLLRRGAGRVLIVEWGGTEASATRTIFAAEPAVRVLSVRAAAGVTAAPDLIALPPGTDGVRFHAALRSGLAHIAAEAAPEVVLLSAGFDVLAGDPLGPLRVEPREFYDLTLLLREWADRHCHGRLVSVLEGGYDAAALGRAAVQHLRALSGLPPG